MATTKESDKRTDKTEKIDKKQKQQATELEPRREASLGKPSTWFGPFGLMRRMFGDLERMMGFGWLRPFATDTYFPQFDVVRRGDKIVVRADLPGLAADDVEVTLDDGSLVVTGERRADREYEEGDVWRSERSYGRFERVIPLPEGVDAESCEARFDNGVLEIELKAPEKEQKGKKIEIKSGEPGGAQPVTH